MTLSVHIQYTEGDIQVSDIIGVTSAAMEAIRFQFNPSGKEDVTSLKALAAAFIAKCDQVVATNPDAGRELAVAKTNMQTASMWAVLGATKAPIV